MRVLIAPDSFKGSLSSSQFCHIAEKAILDEVPNAEVVRLPLADGGEGTVASIVENTHGRYEKVRVNGPLCDSVEADIGIIEDGKTAVIEMASASGLALIPIGKNDPMKATTWGTGELILKALDLGVERVILGLGGSATNDGGAGMLQALGAGLFNSEGDDIALGGEGLLQLYSIDFSSLDARLRDIEIIVACDVVNPLLGSLGATRVYGKQKGADKHMQDTLERALSNFSKVCKLSIGTDYSEAKGSGAAGGLGFGLYIIGGTVKSGFSLISEIIGLEKIIAERHFDLILSGEGRFDEQSAYGKLLSGIFTLAGKYDIPVIVLCGSSSEVKNFAYPIISIVNGPMSLKDAIENANDLLYSSVRNLVKVLRVGGSLSL